MPASTDVPTRQSAPLRVAFDGAPGATRESVVIPTPWLAGAGAEEIFPGTVPIGESDGVRLYRCGGLLIGHVREPFVSAELAARAEALYRRLLAATHGLHLCRVWNYVPRINAHTAGLEHYQAFCQGRAVAFERAHGGAFQRRLPAASAVGSGGEHLDAIFVASDAAPLHFENPEQLPAYRYPPEHGPRAPSFARATVVRDGGGTWTFISGTAAIKGHQTIAPDALDAQLDCTLDNLRLIAGAVGLGDNLAAGRAAQRHFKVYLRHATDLASVQARLNRELLTPQDRVTYLQAEICRAALAIEIEATICDGPEGAGGGR